jgi:hypothetical protein
MILRGDVPFFNAESLIPTSLTSKLGRSGHTRLSLAVILSRCIFSSAKPFVLQSIPVKKPLVDRLISFKKFYTRDFDMVFPKPNYPLLLCRFMHQFCLPGTCICGAKTTESLISFVDFLVETFPVLMELLETNGVSSDHLPEIHCTAAIVIFLQMVYGLDGHKRWLELLVAGRHLWLMAG